MTTRSAKLKGFADGFNARPYPDLRNETRDVRLAYAEAYVVGSSL